MRLTHLTYGLCAFALALAACSGSGGSIAPVVPASTATPVLAVGSIAQYNGTDTVAHVFPSAAANYTAGYTFVATRTIASSAAGAPAPYDVNTSMTYTTTTNPGQGIEKTSEVSDVFENQASASAGTTLTEVASKTSTTGVDESAGAAGGGPFTQTVAETTTYATPETIGVYPLVTGASIAEPVGLTIGTNTSDANGGAQETASTFDVSSKETVNADGSYTTTNIQSDGQTQTVTENANGSATIVSNGPLFTVNDSIGVPVAGAGGYTIPVIRFRQGVTTGPTPGPVATTVAFSAADWYPGGALPMSPLETHTVTVKGPATTLPAGCTGAIAEPNIIEVDSATSTLNVDGSFATAAQQRFESNAVPVCVLRTVTTQVYAVNFGTLSSTTTENSTQILTSLGTAASAAGKRR